MPRARSLACLLALCAPSARASEVFSLIQTSSVAEPTQYQVAENMRISISDVDMQNTSRLEFFENKLRSLRKELSVEFQMRHDSPSYILKSNNSERLSLQDGATALTLIRKLFAMRRGTPDQDVEAHKVEKHIAKLQSKLHGNQKIGHWISKIRMECHQGPIDSLNRMLYQWKKHLFWEALAEGSQVREGPCWGGPAVWQPAGNMHKGCWGDQVESFHADCKGFGLLEHCFGTSDPVGDWITYKHKELNGTNETYALIITTTVAKACLTTDTGGA